MTLTVSKNVQFDVSLDTLISKMRAKDKQIPELEALHQEAISLASPKALYKIAYIEEKGEDYVIADGIKLTSRILRVNLNSVHRIFPYIITCGTEVAQWAVSFSNLYDRYCADMICELILRSAYKNFQDYLESSYHTGKTSVVNPGSLEDWPLQQQQQLFSLLGDPQTIGVQLTPSYLMTPVKSVSGIRFPTSTDYNNCMLCPRPECTGRQAPYDKELYEKKYRK